MSEQLTLSGIAGNIENPKIPTIREQLLQAETEAHKRLAAVERAKTVIPAKWLDMTNDQLHKAYGIALYF